MFEQKSSVQYRSAHELALASIIIIAIDALLMGLSSIGVALYSLIVNNASDDWRTLYGSALGCITICHFLAFPVGTLSFLLWEHRAYKNLEAFGVKSLSYTPGWAIAYWFIPILNLFRPLFVLNEIWNGSDPERVSTELNIADTSTPSLFGIWWGLRLIGGIGDRLTSMNSGGGEGLGETSYILTLVSTGATIVAFILLIFIVRGIDNRQKIAARNFEVQQLPPPPFG